MELRRFYYFLISSVDHGLGRVSAPQMSCGFPEIRLLQKLTPAGILVELDPVHLAVLVLGWHQDH